jgi:hypothetical protein
MMFAKDMRWTAAASAPLPATALHNAEAGGIIEELDGIVGKSPRISPQRRILCSAGGAFARWADQLVPAQAPAVDPGLPPQIKFPFF